MLLVRHGEDVYQHFEVYGKEAKPPEYGTPLGIAIYISNSGIVGISRDSNTAQLLF